MSTITVRTCFLLSICCLSFPATSAIAATFNGTIEEISVDDNTVTVKLAGKKDESKTFTLATSVTIMLDGKKSKLEDVVEGQTVTVVVNSSDEATRLTLKTPKTAKTPAAKQVNSKAAGDDNDGVESGFWPQYRGPNRDNISTEKGLLDKWPKSGPKVAWKQKGLGDGYSSVSIAKGKLYTDGQPGR